MKNPKRRFSRLYDKYVEKIYRFVLLKVESQEVAEDLTSQVFTKAWDKFRIVNNPHKNKIKNPTAYIYQIARAEIANHHRQKAKFQVISTDMGQIDDSQAVTEPTAEENQELESEIEILKKNLKQLKDDYQDIIIWRYLDGFSIKKIAQITERPEGTVRVMIHRALKELKEKMKK